VTLLDLAKDKFKSRELTTAEKELFTKTELGQAASALAPEDKDNDPGNVNKWPNLASRTIQAECLTLLCTDKEIAKRVGHRGIELYGVRIEGLLDLEFAEIPFPFQTWKCAFVDNINLRHAHLPAVYFQRTRVKDLLADGIEIDGWFFFRDKSRANGEVNLTGAKVGGGLEFTDAEFIHPNLTPTNNDTGKQIVGSTAFTATTAKIDGSIYFVRAKAEGEINLVAATIGGNLECDQAEFVNPIQAVPGPDGSKGSVGGLALSASGAKIGGDVYLRKGFKAQGEVNFGNAKISGNLECTRAELENVGGKALSAGAVNVAGAIFLRDALKVLGEVNIIGGNVGASLECDGAEFSAPGGYALNAERCMVKGNVFLRNQFKDGQWQIATVDGKINFLGSEIGSYFVWAPERVTENTSLDFRSAKVGTLRDYRNWPSKKQLFLDGFVYQRIDDSSPTDAKSRIQWLNRQPEDSFLPQPYEQLALVLKNMGHEGRARAIMVEKNCAYARAFAKNLQQKKWWHKIPQKIWARISKQEWWWYNVLGRLNGYGYKPWRAFFLSLAVIFLGWGLFHFGYTRNLILPERDNAFRKNVFGHVVTAKNIPQKHRLSKSYPKFNALAYSLESFVPLLKLDQSANWTPNAHNGRVFFLWGLHLNAGTLLRGYLWFHIIIGWILTSLWIGGLTGLVKT
jgi:hypothetical protein